MSAQTDFSLNRSGSIYPIECIEIIHSSFSQVYRFVRNKKSTISVTHEDLTVHEYIHTPMEIDLGSSKDDLDLGIAANIYSPDLLNDLDKLCLSGDMVKPEVNYRVYRSDYLAEPIITVLQMELFKGSEGDMRILKIESGVPKLNSSGTGIIYDYEQFPLLKGF